jgi:NAD(P)-dependent dehydrogenase (short-subunit alcohol dehydrogenase family)
MNTGEPHNQKSPEYAQPPFPAQTQSPPGSEAAMRPLPDFGELTYRGSGKLSHKAALITGGDSGIGRAVALAFAREGADVLISYLNEHEDAETTLAALKQEGRKALAVSGDISDYQHCSRLVDLAMANFGRLDILINNAALQNYYPDIFSIPAQDWEATFKTNLFPMFYLSQLCLKHLPAGGTIVNTASIQAYQPSDFLMPYAASKGAIVTFTKALSQAALKKGVRVNAVAPGPVWTPLIPHGMPPEKVTEFGKSSPMGRPAQPAELAPAYVFLASSDSSYITGEILGVTGGKFF